jgi:hypothetical protein
VVKRWCAVSIIVLAAVAAIFSFAPVAVLGQTSATSYMPPRTRDGHPDLQGIWQVLNTAAWNIEDHNASLGVPAGQGVVEGGAVPYQPWALERRKENFEKRATLNPEASCYLPGVPRITYMPYPFRIVQQADKVSILYEYLGAVRYLYMNGNPHPRGPIEWFMGDSRARWEGNTLVVDVTYFTDQTWLDRAGNFHSEALHVVERYTRTSPDHMLYDVTIEDPKVFTRPWKMSMPLYRRQERNLELFENECMAYLLEQEWDRLDSPLFKLR